MSTKPWAQGKQNRCREDTAAPCGTAHYRFISAGSIALSAPTLRADSVFVPKGRCYCVKKKNSRQPNKDKRLLLVSLSVNVVSVDWSWFLCLVGSTNNS